MEKENIKSGTFADNIGVQQSTFSHVINGKRKASLDVVMKVHQYYRHINLDWLLYGKGEMIAGEESEYSAGSSSDGPLSQATHHAHTSVSKQSGIFPSLFDQNPENADEESKAPKKHLEITLEKPIEEHKRAEIQQIKYIERPPRKITEIRIFFDDNTYETFMPEK